MVKSGLSTYPKNQRILNIAADSLAGYMLVGSTIPPFADILYDIDCLFKVNRIGNGLDIVNDINFKAAMAQEAIAKIEKLSKLITWDREQVRFTEFKAAFRQTFAAPPPSGTFYGQNSSRDYDSKEYGRERRSRTRSMDRSLSRSRDL